MWRSIARSLLLLMESNGVPEINKALLRFLYAIYNPALRMREGVSRITVSPAEWERLVAYRGKRAMLLCNHPTWHDPPVVFGLSRLLGDPFYFAAMEELFEGIVGEVVRRIGVFPIKRGKPDRKALKICQSILTDHNGKLVLFPEGEAHERNDVRLPISEGGDGAAQIGFWAATALMERGDGADISMPIIVLSVFYALQSDPAPALHKGIARVEKILGLAHEESPLESRFARAERFALNGVEHRLGLDVRYDVNDNERLTRLRERIEEKVCVTLNAPLPLAKDSHLRIRSLYSLIQDIRNVPVAGMNERDRRIHEALLQEAQLCYKDIERVQRWVVAGLDAPGEGSSAERLAERLRRLEAEVLGQVRTHFTYEAIIRVAEPFDLCEMLPLYKTARREAIRQATLRTEALFDGFLHEWRDRKQKYLT